jgi:hypothetical protein
MPMELAMVPFTPETGEPVVIFAFRPRQPADERSSDDLAGKDSARE